MHAQQTRLKEIEQILRRYFEPQESGGESDLNRVLALLIGQDDLFFMRVAKVAAPLERAMCLQVPHPRPGRVQRMLAYSHIRHFFHNFAANYSLQERDCLLREWVAECELRSADCAEP